MKHFFSDFWVNLNFHAKALAAQILPELENLSIMLIKALVVMVVGWYVSKFLRTKIRKVLESRDKVLASFIGQASFVLSIIVIGVAVLGTLGVQIASIIAVLGTAGVAIALALKDSLSSIASGIVIIILRPFRIGDTIEAAGFIGVVEAINLFNTQLRLIDGKLAIMPNNNIANANIINQTMGHNRLVEWSFGVGYGSDIEKVKAVATAVLKANGGVDSKKTMFVGMTSMGDSALIFTMRYYVLVEEGGVWQIRSQIVEALKKALDSEGIEIPFNKLDVTILEQKNA